MELFDAATTIKHRDINFAVVNTTDPACNSFCVTWNRFLRAGVFILKLERNAILLILSFFFFFFFFQYTVNREIMQMLVHVSHTRPFQPVEVTRD